MDDRTEKDADIEAGIAEIFKNFNFIAVTERYYESMIILAAYLNVPIENIYSPSRQKIEWYPTPQFNKRQIDIFKKYFKIDLLIYEISNMILDDHIKGMLNH